MAERRLKANIRESVRLAMLSYEQGLDTRTALEMATLLAIGYLEMDPARREDWYENAVDTLAAKYANEAKR